MPRRYDLFSAEGPLRFPAQRKTLPTRSSLTKHPHTEMLGGIRLHQDITLLLLGKQAHIPNFQRSLQQELRSHASFYVSEDMKDFFLFHEHSAQETKETATPHPTAFDRVVVMDAQCIAGRGDDFFSTVRAALRPTGRLLLFLPSAQGFPQRSTWIQRLQRYGLSLCLRHGALSPHLLSFQAAPSPTRADFSPRTN